MVIGNIDDPKHHFSIQSFMTDELLLHFKHTINILFEESETVAIPYLIKNKNRETQMNY